MRMSVLIADDDEMMRTLLQGIVGRLFNGDLEVLIACNGAEALEIAREKTPDLAILDIRMPKIDGLNVCRALKAEQHTHGVQVILVSAEASPDIRREAEDAGADAFFSKPFKPSALIEASEAALRQGPTHEQE